MQFVVSCVGGEEACKVRAKPPERKKPTGLGTKANQVRQALIKHMPRFEIIGIFLYQLGPRFFASELRLQVICSQFLAILFFGPP
jgi:hypothetical protein